jgi:hypothetical protein
MAIDRFFIPIFTIFFLLRKTHFCIIIPKTFPPMKKNERIGNALIESFVKRNEVVLFIFRSNRPPKDVEKTTASSIFRELAVLSLPDLRRYLISHEQHFFILDEKRTTNRLCTHMYVHKNRASYVHKYHAR